MADGGEDAERRRKAKVPEDIKFETKPQLALAQIRQALDQGLPRGVVLMVAGYGHDAVLRLGVTALGLPYVASVQRDTLVFTPGHQPRAGHTRPKSGRRQRHVVSVEDVARSLPAETWRTLTWREGGTEPLSGRFARARLVSAHRHRTPPNGC